jgi:5'-AMP-activated protein kinase catalytic alpha subunit
MQLWGKYKCEEIIGEGSYGIVQKVIHPETYKKCALKIFKQVEQEDQFDSYENETKNHKALFHDNIVEIIEHSSDDDNISENGSQVKVNYIVMELLPNGDIHNYIADTDKFAEPLARYYMKQLINAVEYMHRQGIAHRDLKLDNIILDKKFNAKIIDFGFSDSNEKSGEFKGTHNFIAPEMFAEDEFETKPLDVFALGVWLFIMVQGCLPFLEATGFDKLYRIFWTNQNQFWLTHYKKFKHKHSKSFVSLMQRMLHPNPARRIAIKDLKNHKWFKGKTLLQKEVFVEMSIRLAKMRLIELKQK